VPYIAQVAVGRREYLSVFGGDYETEDGTGVRDYVHVLDVAEGHVMALDYLRRHAGCVAVNLGTGRGMSVLDMLHEYERASGRSIAYEVTGRRPGDVARCWAQVSLARDLFGWQATREVEQMCQDSWRWQLANPDGYA
jgi:UDP-glucose 4-epimerase